MWIQSQDRVELRPGIVECSDPAEVLHDEIFRRGHARLHRGLHFRDRSFDDVKRGERLKWPGRNAPGTGHGKGQRSDVASHNTISRRSKDESLMRVTPISS
jgi:hypothetical protein